MKSIASTILISSVFGLFLYSSSSWAQSDSDTTVEASSPTSETPLGETTDSPTMNAGEDTDSAGFIGPTEDSIKDSAETNPVAESTPPTHDNSAVETAIRTTVASSEQNKPTREDVVGPRKASTSPNAPQEKSEIEESTAADVNLNPFIALGDEMFFGTVMITAWGVAFWDWFETSFHFEKEYGFTQESSTGGADKTGHFYTAYIFADFLNWRLRRQGWPKLRSTVVSASVAMGLMTWIEVGDATSAYGWSWEDMLADFIGVMTSAGLAMSPVADDLLDFRLEYWPTSSYLDGGVMAADYSGMKYMMALRMTGIKPLKKTPLRFIEWHLGYYTRGFRSFDQTRDTNRVVYFGIGLDLKELFNKFVPKKYMRPFDVAFTYYQVPFASWPIKKWEHPAHNARPARPFERFDSPTDPPVR